MQTDERNNETIKVNTQAESVEDSKEKGVRVQTTSLGKFKDVESLIKAYNNLEAEFTKRCQRIKELEGEVKADKTENIAQKSVCENAGDDNKVQEEIKTQTIITQTQNDNAKEEQAILSVPTEKSGENYSQEKSITKEEKEKILFEYLTEIIDSKSKAVLLDNKGVGIKTPVSKPKSITEAGMLAKEIF